ncbi:MAG: tetratricopeptide repeat protein [Bacteroidales bacterium]|nr:tetratricopeptide repeat protein [Bacteroidales bacterium]
MDEEERRKQAAKFFTRGNTYYDKCDYDKAIEDYNKAIELNPDDANAYNNRGNAYALKCDYDKAIEDYNKSIELEPGLAEVYNNRGNIYAEKGDYDHAIEDYNKTITLNPDIADAHNNRGTAYGKKGDYDKAIEDYNKAIKLKPDYAGAYNNRGSAYNDKGDYDKAIEDCNKAIALNSDDAKVYNNRGNAYNNKGDYDKAIEDYNKAIALKPDYARAYDNLIRLCQNGNCKYIETVARVLNDNKNHFKIDIVYAMSQYKNIDELINKLWDIDYGDYFCRILKYNKIDKESKEYRDYKQIYLSSIKIMQLLHVNNPEETVNGFAHYTHKDIAEKLLIKKEAKVSPFRLGSILHSNDPTEGTIAFEYLDLESKDTDRSYQAFTACFTFDPECLNQFRLYGKEQGQEATGVSMIFRKDFFAEAPSGMASESLMSGLNGKLVTRTKEDTRETYPLYRCAYIDPETKQIVALGHKDDYTFFRDNSKEDIATIQDKINQYKDSIDKKLQAVRKQFNELKELIKKNEKSINKETVCDLLINLRYLVKHIAFKEEQECRIVKVEALGNHEKVKLEGDRMFFIDTEAIGRYIDKIYFAPNTAGMEFFQERLVYEGEGSKHIKCNQCKHPIRVAKS